MKRSLAAIIIITTAILILVPGIIAYSQEDIRVEKIEASVQSKLDSIYDPETDFGGATMGLILPDGQILRFAIGFSDVENKIKMKPSDRMLGGSTGKIFVSASIMQLVEKGIIDLDDRVRIYFTDIEWYDRIQNSGLITIRNLLQHSSGISRYVFEEGFQNDVKKDPDRIWHPDELLRYVLDKDPLFEPGTDFAYSDTNYIILGMIIEKVTGITMYEYIDQNILIPNDLAKISPQITRTIENLAAGYSSESDEFFPGKVAEDGIYKYNVQFEWAGGGFIMNTGDLAAAGKLIYEGRIFNEGLLPQFFSGIEAKGLGGKWGLGVHIRETPSGITYGHSGFFPGYITNMIYFPEYRCAIAIQVNTSSRENMGLYRKLFQLIPVMIKTVSQ